MTDQQLDLDAIETCAAAATPGPWGFYDGDNYADVAADLQITGRGSYSYREKVARLEDENYWDDPAHEDDDDERAPEQMAANAAFIAAARTAVPAMAAEIRRLRTDAAAELLPAWEAVYEPGNVSDYLIGYANNEQPAKAAAEAWLRSQAEVTGRLEWVPDEQLATGRYDRWFELVEHHDDGIPTGPGLIVRRRAAVEAHVVADDSDDPEHVDDCPGCTRPCGYDDYHDPHEWADKPDTWCPGHSIAADEAAASASARP